MGVSILLFSLTLNPGTKVETLFVVVVGIVMVVELMVFVGASPALVWMLLLQLPACELLCMLTNEKQEVLALHFCTFPLSLELLIWKALKLWHMVLQTLGQVKGGFLP